VAGGAPAGPNLHLARFRCVDAKVAEKIRELVGERMKYVRGAGLGDPEDAGGKDEPAGIAGLRLAAQEAATESRLLREAAERLSAPTA